LGGVLTDEEYTAVEHAVYEAAVVPELWPKVLTGLGEFSNSAGAALFCFNERGIHFVSAPILEPVFKRFVDEKWDERNSRRGNVMARGLTGLPRFVNEDDYLAPGEAETDPMINELFRPEGFGWAAGFVQELPHGDLAVLNLEQYYERGPIRGETLDRLNAVYPHIARAAMLAARSDLQRVRTAVETLAAIGIPASAVTLSGRVVLANDAFAAATHVWTTRGGDRLGLHDQVAGRMLADALAAIELAQGPRSIPVRAEPGGAVTAVIQVVPVRRQAHDIFGSTSAIVILSELKAQAADATLVQSLFDLTPAEIAVAQSIASGLTVVQISKATGRAVPTIRNQVRSAMSKTGSTRQAELILLMRQLARRDRP
jgi:DNA-binding CsgD family transcriptional regulator